MMKKLIKKYNIPEDVHLMSDSGWECEETEMCGVYYNKAKNLIIFTQTQNDFNFHLLNYEQSAKEDWIELNL